jgi:pimeloyl-ACP methyl ester carboxylesterase
VHEEAVEFTTIDGVVLRGSHVYAAGKSKAVLVHGAGADRNEDGLFNQVAVLLRDIGVSSLRFDLRGHGESEGQRQWVTLTSTLNDIAAATHILIPGEDSPQVHLIASSFSGGATAYFAATRGAKSLILINPVLDYKRQYLSSKNYWNGTNIDGAGKRALDEEGWIDHRGVLRLSRQFLGELSWIDPVAVAADIQIPVLVFHGTNDQRVPWEISETWMSRIRHGRLVLVPGADHEIAVTGDKFHELDQTKEWHRQLLTDLVNWIRGAEGI